VNLDQIRWRRQKLRQTTRSHSSNGRLPNRHSSMVVHELLSENVVGNDADATVGWNNWGESVGRRVLTNL
jgi:hypothetical protein